MHYHSLFHFPSLLQTQQTQISSADDIFASFSSSSLFSFSCAVKQNNLFIVFESQICLCMHCLLQIVTLYITIQEQTLYLIFHTLSILQKFKKKTSIIFGKIGQIKVKPQTLHANNITIPVQITYSRSSILCCQNVSIKYDFERQGHHVRN